MASNKRWMGCLAIGAALFCAPGPRAQARADLGDLPGAPMMMLAGVRDLGALAGLATASEPRVAAAARGLLRAAGPAGLAAFRDLHRDELARAVTDLSPRTGAAAEVLSALDELCAQKDCAASQLYWYTDLEQAKAAARASGRPIVSLRLLGDLREELSCANSRFFRALLYPDPAVSAALRERFVLHWQTERPAPKITIDLGDGRRIEGTITGNSAHYLLDSAGRPVDVLPGLMAPRQFLAALQASELVAREVAAQDAPTRAATLRSHHAARLQAQANAWRQATAAIGQRDRGFEAPPRPGEPVRARAPRAGQAAMLAITKSAVEVPLLRGFGEPVDRLTNDEVWGQLGDRGAAQVELSPASLALIARQQWRSGAVDQDAADLALALAALRRTVATDGLYNEFGLHRRVHEWFVGEAADALDLEALDRRVYGELFLTPRSDPWLGLAAPTIYSGLTGGGRQARI